jgi:hypothetical protein
MTTADAALKTGNLKTVMDVVSFDKQLQHARELVNEGKRLLTAANRDLSVGTVLVKRSHQRLTDTDAYFRRRNSRAISPAKR